MRGNKNSGVLTLGSLKIYKFLGFLLLVSFFVYKNTIVLAQSIVENIRPIGEVCLVGQSCVGVKAELSINGVGSSTNELELSPIEEKPEDTQSEVNTNEPLGGESNGFDVSAAYQSSCFACHASGAAGAPLLGDAEAWESRLEKGMDALMTNVINGMNAMPAKGLCMDCSDNELQAIVDYMISQ